MFELINNDLLHHKIYLSCTVKNENDTTALTTIPAPFWIEKISLLKNGNTIVEYDGYYHYFKNLEKFNANLNGQYYEDILGVSKDDHTTVLPLTANASRNYLICLYQSLHRSNILASLVKDLILRVKFRKTITNSAVLDSDIIFSDVKLIFKQIETTDLTIKHILSHPKVDHLLLKPYHYTRLINNLTANVETYVEIDLKHVINQLWFWFGPMNPTNSQLLNMYEVKDLYITNPQNLNILNSKKLSSLELKTELYNIFGELLPSKYNFYRKLNNFYVLDFSNNADV